MYDTMKKFISENDKVRMSEKSYAIFSPLFIDDNMFVKMETVELYAETGLQLFVSHICIKEIMNNSFYKILKIATIQIAFFN